MTIEAKPEKKLFPPTEEMIPGKLELPTRKLFRDLKQTLNSIPQFVTATALGLFWQESEVEFRLGDNSYSVRHKKTPHPDSGYSIDFIRILRFGKWLEDKKTHESYEDIVLRSGKPTYKDHLNPSISYVSEDHERHHESASNSEAAIQKVQEFVERLKKLAQSETH